MGTENKSPSYLEEREQVRRALSNTPEGRYAVDLLIQQDGKSVVGKALNEDSWLDWKSLWEEHKDDLILASNCEALRNAFELSRKSSSMNQPPMSQGSRLLRFFSPPMWYVLRRQIEVGDPDFWSDPENMIREALANPQWATVPADYLRGKLLDLIGCAGPGGEEVTPLFAPDGTRAA